jgi:hypothetical protein
MTKREAWFVLSQPVAGTRLVNLACSRTFTNRRNPNPIVATPFRHSLQLLRLRTRFNAIFELGGARLLPARLLSPPTRRYKQHRSTRLTTSTPHPNTSDQPPPCFSQKTSCTSRASLRASGLPPTSTRSSPKPKSCKTRSMRTSKSSFGQKGLPAVLSHCD